jgi:ABC-type nickel/cobalt efflux system permease component RcnA
MKKLLAGTSIGASVWVLPLICFAQEGNLQGVLITIGEVVGLAVPVAASLVMVAFFWGLAMYLFNFGEGKDDKQKQGKSLMIYSVLVMFVMVSIWGIVELFAYSFDITTGGTLPVPQISVNPSR